MGSVVIAREVTGELEDRVCMDSPVFKFHILIEQSVDPDTNELSSCIEYILRHTTDSICPINVRNDRLVSLSYALIV